jgi:hypothetical protein
MRNGLIVLVVLSAAPAAYAALGVSADITFLRRPETTVEVFLEPRDTTGDDRLNRFQLKLEMEGGSPGGLHFSPAPRETVGHPSLFPGVQFQDLGSDFDTLFVGGALPAGQGVDVTDFRNGLLTAVVEVPDGFVPDRGSYPLRVDPSGTAFFDVDGQAVPFRRRRQQHSGSRAVVGGHLPGGGGVAGAAAPAAVTGAILQFGAAGAMRRAASRPRPRAGGARRWGGGGAANCGAPADGRSAPRRLQVYSPGWRDIVVRVAMCRAAHRRRGYIAEAYWARNSGTG